MPWQWRCRLYSSKTRSLESKSLRKRWKIARKELPRMHKSNKKRRRDSKAKNTKRLYWSITSNPSSVNQQNSDLNSPVLFNKTSMPKIFPFPNKKMPYPSSRASSRRHSKSTQTERARCLSVSRRSDRWRMRKKLWSWRGIEAKRRAFAYKCKPKGRRPAVSL